MSDTGAFFKEPVRCSLSFLPMQSTCRLLAPFFHWRHAQVSSESFNQPIFGCNNLSGVVQTDDFTAAGVVAGTATAFPSGWGFGGDGSSQAQPVTAAQAYNAMYPPAPGDASVPLATAVHPPLAYASFRIEFRNGGFGTFVPLFYRALAAARNATPALHTTSAAFSDEEWAAMQAGRVASASAYGDPYDNTTVLAAPPAATAPPPAAMGPSPPVYGTT
ncbi:unnamed protein product [Phaeothamnion confervicola]